MYYTIFDIETTGLYRDQSDVIQFAYVNLDENFQPIKSDILYFYYEGMSWSEEAEAVHHISLETLKQHADEFENNLLKMYVTLSFCNAVTFNGDHFDIPFVRAWLMRQGMPEIRVSMSYDVMQIYNRVLHHAIKLVNLPKQIGLPVETIQTIQDAWFGNIAAAHDAAYDTTATALAFSFAMRKKYISKPTSEIKAVKVELEDKPYENDVFYKIEDDGVQYIVNTCSNISQFQFNKLPIDFEGEKTAGMKRALESSMVFFGKDGTYTNEIAEGVTAVITITDQACSFNIRR